MPPNRYDPAAIHDEAPPRENMPASYTPRTVPTKKGARKLRGPQTAPAKGDTVSFDEVQKGSRWQSEDAGCVNVRRTGERD